MTEKEYIEQRLSKLLPGALQIRLNEFSETNFQMKEEYVYIVVIRDGVYLRGEKTLTLRKGYASTYTNDVAEDLAKKWSGTTECLRTITTMVEEWL